MLATLAQIIKDLKNLDIVTQFSNPVHVVSSYHFTFWFHFLLLPLL